MLRVLDREDVEEVLGPFELEIASYLKLMMVEEMLVVSDLEYRDKLATVRISNICSQ